MRNFICISTPLKCGIVEQTGSFESKQTWKTVALALRAV